MIIPDVNLLLYANVDGFPQHPAARTWWEALLNGRVEVGIGAPAVYGFLRIATSRRLLDPPMSVEDAIARAESWLARPRVRFLVPGPRHIDIAFGLLRHLGAAANLTTDTHLAALAIEYQAELHSSDSDFARFPQLRWFNPIA